MSIYADMSKTGSNLVDKDSVLESVRNILNTLKGERLFNRGFGTNLEKYLFSPLNFTNSQLILVDVTSAITKYDPRVIIVSQQVELDYDNRCYRINLGFRIKGLDTVIDYSEELSIK